MTVQLIQMQKLYLNLSPVLSTVLGPLELIFCFSPEGG